jgi:competence protein ComEC
MSFGAIIGLIALAEWQRRRPRDGAPPTQTSRVLGWVKRYVVGLILASTVAGLATAPFAIYHFDRAPGYSLLSNLLATPLVGIVIMPAACVTVAAMPFHLEYAPLQIMGWGVGRLTDIAHWVASLPGAVSLLPAWSDTVLICIVAGGIWLGLWRRAWRWLGLAPIAFGLALALAGRQPDVLIARDAAAIAVRGPDGHLALLGKPDDYTAGQWLLRDGDPREVGAAKTGGRCDEWGCVATAAGGQVVALALRPGAVVDDCARAAILVSTIPLRQSCTSPKRVLDRFDVLDKGAMALFLVGDGVRVVSVAETRGSRPWSARRQ